MLPAAVHVFEHVWARLKCSEVDDNLPFTYIVCCILFRFSGCVYNNDNSGWFVTACGCVLKKNIYCKVKKEENMVLFPKHEACVSSLIYL